MCFGRSQHNRNCHKIRNLISYIYYASSYKYKASSMKNIIRFALLILLCPAILARASVVSASLNDLILGFSATDATQGDGTNVNLEMDLGNVGQYYSLPSNTSFQVANLGVDLAAAFDGIWDTRTDLFWGIAGTTGSATGTTINSTTIAAKTLWAGKVESTAGVQSTPWNRAVSFTQQNPANSIATLYSSATGSLNGKTALSDNPKAALLDNSIQGSWSQQEGSTTTTPTPTAPFGGYAGFNPGSSFQTSTNFSSIAGSFAVLDLYELQPGSGAGTYIGSFGLNSSGILEFSNTASFFSAEAAIPEPETYAVLLGAMALGGAFMRRRLRTGDPSGSLPLD